MKKEFGIKTGIVRRLDYLGRIMIPKEIRRQLCLKEDDPFEFYIYEDGVYIKKLNQESKDTTEIKKGYKNDR